MNLYNLALSNILGAELRIVFKPPSVQDYLNDPDHSEESSSPTLSREPRASKVNDLLGNRIFGSKESQLYGVDLSEFEDACMPFKDLKSDKPFKYDTNESCIIPPPKIIGPNGSSYPAKNIIPVSTVNSYSKSHDLKPVASLDPRGVDFSDQKEPSSPKSLNYLNMLDDDNKGFTGFENLSDQVKPTGHKWPEKSKEPEPKGHGSEKPKEPEGSTDPKESTESEPEGHESEPSSESSESEVVEGSEVPPDFVISKINYVEVGAHNAIIIGDNSFNGSKCRRIVVNPQGGIIIQDEFEDKKMVIASTQLDQIEDIKVIRISYEAFAKSTLNALSDRLGQISSMLVEAT